jgi:hypothetical protein
MGNPPATGALMRLIPHSVSEAVRVFALLLLLWATAGAFAMYKTHEAKVEAQHFLQDLKLVRAGPCPFSVVVNLSDKYHGVWSESTNHPPPCGGPASRIDFKFDNHWSHRILFAPYTMFWAGMTVNGNHVCNFEAGTASFGGPHEVLGPSYDVWDYSKMISGFEGGGHFQVDPGVPHASVLMDAEATAAQREIAFAFNLNCLTKLRGCRDAKEMNPEAWQAGVEQIRRIQREAGRAGGAPSTPAGAVTKAGGPP